MTLLQPEKINALEKAMSRPYGGRRIARPIARRYHRVDQSFFLRRRIGDLKIRRSSRRVRYAALAQWCRRDCSQKVSGNISRNVMLPETREVAGKIGREFWGDRGSYRMERKRKRRAGPLMWPKVVERDRITAGFRVFLSAMTARQDLRQPMKEEATAPSVAVLTLIGSASRGWPCG